METTPIYTELVVKYYLSKGIKPFSYPHEPVDVITVPKIKAGDYLGTVPKTDNHGNPHIAFDLRAEPVVNKTYNYFRL